MIIDDFVMLGRTVPEQSKKHGLVSCSAGYSREMQGFMRIYPVPARLDVPRWSVCKIHLERPSTDNRKESFRIKDGTKIEIIGKRKKDDEYDYLESLRSPSIAVLNQDRESLAIIRPENLTYRFDGAKPGEEYQMSLPWMERERPETPKPRVQFFDDSGKHDLQLRDLGSSIFLKKYRLDQLWSALKLDDPGYEHLFFCGNHNQHRNNWLVISVVSRKINTNANLELVF